MSLDAHVVVENRGVDARIAVDAGSTLVILGPNGAGKSTVLEAIAGIVPVSGGRISRGDETLSQGGKGAPARARGIGLLSQDDALFTSMSVLDNVAFGPRSRGMSRERARAEAHEWLERVGVPELASRPPRTLSGGQSRRVAVARALAASPSVMLLDEPFAGLDVPAASGMRALVAELLADITAIVTTHDALDAHALADSVAIMEGGGVIESGPAGRVLTEPCTSFGARMAARVLLGGVIEGGALVADAGVSVPVTGGLASGTRAAIAVRPADIVIEPSGGTSTRPRSARHAWVTQAVVALEPRGDTVRIHGRTLAADVDPSRAVALSIGSSVAFGVPHGLPAYAL